MTPTESITSASNASERAKVAHLVRRAGFGLPSDDLDRMAADGYEAAVERVIAGLHRPDPGADSIPPPRFDSARLVAAFEGNDPAVRQEAQRTIARERRELVRWWLQRMLAADEPWREKLTFHWHDHFSTSFSKVRFPELMWLQHSTLHRLGPGRFDELVHAISRDGAMLIWLDGNDNRVGAPNENFARELFELFTLGHSAPASPDHDGHHGDPAYTEDDVQAAARALTGWRVDRSTGAGVFTPSRHDTGPKTLLGVTGQLGLDDVVRLATTHPACGPHVVARLWSRFARPATASDPVVVELARDFSRDLDTTALLRRMFMHSEFTSSVTRTALVKTPVEWMVGALRMVRHDLPDGAEELLFALGQVPFAPPDVAGWPANGAWLSTASARLRLEGATYLAGVADLSSLSSTPKDRRVQAIGRLLAVERWGSATLAALESVASDPARLLALALVSPEFMTA